MILLSTPFFSHWSIPLSILKAVVPIRLSNTLARLNPVIAAIKSTRMEKYGCFPTFRKSFCSYLGAVPVPTFYNLLPNMFFFFLNRNDRFFL
jgi:hypothetical protein